MGLWSQLISRETQIELTLAEGWMVLRCSEGGRPAPFSAVARKWPQLSLLRPYFPQESATEAAVPPEQAKLVRTLMVALKELGQRPRLRFEISDAASKGTARRARETSGRHAYAGSFLAHLELGGASGGLTGGYEAFAAYGMPFLTQYTVRHPNADVMILGSKEDVEALKTRPEAKAWKLAVIRSYDWLHRAASVRSTDWQLLVLIEPDACSDAVGQKRLQEVLGLTARQTIGFFLREPATTEERSRAAALLRLKSPDTLSALIRNPRHPCSLPEESLPVAPSPVIQPTGEKRAPARPAVAPAPAAPVVRAAPVVQPVAISVSPKGPGFLQEARRLAGYEQEGAAPVPFTGAQPVYADMNQGQRAWYFTLRTKWRRGEYPDADAAYLYVHIYELLEQVGAKNAADGYRQLMALWRAYRDRAPSLDGQMGQWMSDYIHVWNCGVTDEMLLADAPSLESRALDAALIAMEANPEAKIPLWALEIIADYRISTSKFSQRGHEELMAAALPGAVRYLDVRTRAETGRGLIETHAPIKQVNEKVLAFAGTPRASERRYALKIHHATSRQELSRYLRNVMRYTENQLRAKLKFGARLQGITLDEKTCAQITEYVDAFFAQAERQRRAEEKAREKIALDQEHLMQLRQESDELRETLLATLKEQDAAQDMAEEYPAAEKVEVEETAVQAGPGRPGESDASVLDDAWQAFFQAADPDALAAAGEGEMALAAFARSRHQMPDVVLDELNDLAQDTIGDLIADASGILEDYRDIVTTYLRRE